MTPYCAVNEINLSGELCADRKQWRRDQYCARAFLVPCEGLAPVVGRLTPISRGAAFVHYNEIFSIWEAQHSSGTQLWTSTPCCNPPLPNAVLMAKHCVPVVLHCLGQCHFSMSLHSTMWNLHPYQIPPNHFTHHTETKLLLAGCLPGQTTVPEASTGIPNTSMRAETLTPWDNDQSSWKPIQILLIKAPLCVKWINCRCFAKGLMLYFLDSQLRRHPWWQKALVPTILRRSLLNVRSLRLHTTLVGGRVGRKGGRWDDPPAPAPRFYSEIPWCEDP